MRVEIYVESGLSEITGSVYGEFYNTNTDFENYTIVNKDTLKLTPHSVVDTDLPIQTIVSQSDGKILIGGDFTTINSISSSRIARLNSDHTLDTSFNIGSGFNNAVFDSTVLSDGTVVAVGVFTSYSGSTSNRIVAINPNGTINTSFATGFNNFVEKIEVQSDGKMIITGEFSSFNGSSSNKIIRLNTDFTIDTSFNIGTGFNNLAQELTIQPDGKILVGGFFTSYSGSSSSRIARLNTNGTLDTSFNIGGGFTGFSSGHPLSLLPQNDGKILIGGYSFDTYSGSAVDNLFRINSNGTIDTSFVSQLPAPTTSSFSEVYNLNEISGGYNVVGMFPSYDGYQYQSIINIDTTGSITSTLSSRYDAIGSGSYTLGVKNNTTGSGFINDSLILGDNIILGGGFDEYSYVNDGLIPSGTVETTIYDRLDMFDDENINVKFKLKDTSDLSKVYSTYSQTFTIPTSNKNTKLLNYYFNTDVVRTAKRYLKAKIYINKELFKVGFISINEGKFKYGNNSSYSINFFTSLTNLKELFGDETLATTLQSSSYNIQWNDQIAYDYTRGLAVTSSVDPEVIVPLVSNKRVWTYNDSGLNDIKYTGTKTGVKYIEPSELRPAIPFSRIMDDIAAAKGLTFTSPLFGQDEYEKLYILCNSLATTEYKVILNSVMSGFDSSNWDSTNTSNSEYFNLKYNGTGSSDITIAVNLFLLKYNNSTTEDILPKIVFYNYNTNEILKEDIMTVNDDYDVWTGGLVVNSVAYGLNPSNSINIGIKIIPNQLVYWNTGQVRLLSPGFDKATLTTSRLTFSLSLYNLLPSIKTIDFISSFIKMFNISIIEDPTNNNIINFVPRNEFYQTIKDYTPYIDIEQNIVKPTSLYKNINFKHKTSKYKSNEDFKIGIGFREFGEFKYESTDKFLKDEYKIETQFNIVPNRLIPNTNVQTFYGFTSDSETNGTYGTLYKPNNEDFTIFYYNGSQSLQDINNTNISFNFQSGSSVVELETYNKVSIVYNDNTSSYINSLGYSAEVDVLDNSFVYNKNLFSNYYSNEIARIYNNNARLFEYECYLPAYEINTFNLKDVIIIGNKKFSIEEADINIVTGKSKLTLMNYSPAYTNIYLPPLVPTAPTTFTATLL